MDFLRKNAAVLLIVVIGMGGSMAFSWLTRVNPSPVPPAPVPVPVPSNAYISGSAQRNVGQLAVYRVAKETKQRKWLVIPKAEIEVDEDNARMFLSTEKSGTYTIVLSYLTPDDKLGAESMQVIVGPVGPVPPPTPPAPPTPPTPLTGYALEVFKFTTAKDANGARIYTPAECVKVAESFDRLATQIAAGGIKTVEDAVKELSKSNKELGMPRVWVDFGAWAAPTLSEKGTTLGKVEELFRQIAEGLQAAGGAK